MYAVESYAAVRRLVLIEGRSQREAARVFGLNRETVAKMCPGGIDFDWNSTDEGDQVCGAGWSDLREDGYLEGEISFHNGDEATFIASPWVPFSAAC